MSTFSSLLQEAGQQAAANAARQRQSAHHATCLEKLNDLAGWFAEPDDSPPPILTSMRQNITKPLPKAVTNMFDEQYQRLLRSWFVLTGMAGMDKRIGQKLFSPLWKTYRQELADGVENMDAWYDRILQQWVVEVSSELSAQDPTAVLKKNGPWKEGAALAPAPPTQPTVDMDFTDHAPKHVHNDHEPI